MWKTLARHVLLVHLKESPQSFACVRASKTICTQDLELFALKQEGKKTKKCQRSYENHSNLKFYDWGTDDVFTSDIGSNQHRVCLLSAHSRQEMLSKNQYSKQPKDPKHFSKQNHSHRHVVGNRNSDDIFAEALFDPWRLRLHSTHCNSVGESWRLEKRGEHEQVAKKRDGC